MKEIRTEYYSLCIWNDTTCHFEELCCGDDLEQMISNFHRVHEKKPELRLTLDKVTRIEREESEILMQTDKS